MSVEISITDQIVEINETSTPVQIGVTAGAIIAPTWGGITGTLSNQTDLQNALNAKFDDPTGTTSQYLRGDGTLATFPTITSGTVTSVGLTMPTAFTVANSPVTSSGTLAVTGAGTTSQYVRGDGTLATFPSLTGFVPYTGATANVDLGVYTILAQNATIASSGSGDTATINHSSGSGIALNITKGGNNEGLYINKTGGSGNAATIIGTLNATTLVKSGGLSTEYLKADGSVSTLTNPITGTGTSGQVSYWSGTSTQAGNNNLFWDNTNGRLGIGTNAPINKIHISDGTTPAASLSDATYDFYLSKNTSNANLNLTIASATALQRAVISGIRAKGTLAIPTAVEAADNIFSLLSGAYDGTAIQRSAGIFFDAESSASAGSAPQQINFLTGTTGANRSTKLQVRSNGNVLIQNGGTFTDSGQRLQVTGDTLLKGSGATSATTALTVQNSSSTNLFRVLNDNTIFLCGNTYVKNSATSARFFAGGSFTESMHISAPANRQVCRIVSANIVNGIDNNSSIFEVNQTITSNGTITNVSNTILSGAFSPSSGAVNFNSLLVNNTINQTGGANGITRGLYVNPTLTAAADWRAIEWSNNTGWGLYGAGTANNYLNGSLFIGATTPLSTEKLLVSGLNAGSNIISRIYNTGSTVNTISLLSFTLNTAGGSATAASIGGIGIDTSGNTALIFNTTQSGVGSTEKARITNTGNLLVGSTTDSGEKLQVTGTAKITGAANITGATSFGGNMTLSFNQNAVTSILVQNTNIGSSAQNSIQLQSDAGTASFNVYSSTNVAGASSSVLSSGTLANGLIVRTATTAPIIFATNVTERMRLDSSGSLGIGATSVNASAITQIDSTTKGFLPPRMTTVEKLAISTPAAGLMVYDTTLNKLCVFTTAWETITSL
jgi:hypothetical protein